MLVSIKLIYLMLVSIKLTYLMLVSPPWQRKKLASSASQTYLCFLTVKNRYSLTAYKQGISKVLGKLFPLYRIKCKALIYSQLTT